jgi:hypothetical protein
VLGWKPGFGLLGWLSPGFRAKKNVSAEGATQSMQ